ncbi:hypothetical protein GCM10028821_19660 [Hymenobacter jeollabukensis]
MAAGLAAVVLAGAGAEASSTAGAAAGLAAGLAAVVAGLAVLLAGLAAVVLPVVLLAGLVVVVRVAVEAVERVWAEAEMVAKADRASRMERRNVFMVLGERCEKNRTRAASGSRANRLGQSYRLPSPGVNRMMM